MIPSINNSPYWDQVTFSSVSVTVVKVIWRSEYGQCNESELEAFTYTE